MFPLAKYEVDVHAYYTNAANDVDMGACNFHHKCVSKSAIFQIQLLYMKSDLLIEACLI